MGSPPRRLEVASETLQAFRRGRSRPRRRHHRRWRLDDREACPRREIYIPGGVDKIVEIMKAFDEVAIHSIGDVLESWETVRRSEGVTVSKFIGQFLDLESQCKAKDLVVQTGDARAYKFLRACAMTPDHQRQLLVESRGYDFDRLVSAMRTQWVAASSPSDSQRPRFADCQTTSSSPIASFVSWLQGFRQEPSRQRRQHAFPR